MIAEDTDEVLEDTYSKTITITEREIATFQVVRQGTPSFNDPMDIHPQLSTNPNRASDAFCTIPTKPTRVPVTEKSCAFQIQGPCWLRIGIINPGTTDTITADIYWVVSGS